MIQSQYQDWCILYLCVLHCVVVLFLDDSEETKEFIVSVFQPVQPGCQRCVELLL